MIDPDRILLAARIGLQRSGAPHVLPKLANAVACSDDLWVDGRRLTVRAFVRPAGPDAWVVDLRDSSIDEVGAGPSLDLDDVRFAAVSAFSHALRIESAESGLAEHIELEIDSATWVGSGRPCDAAARLFGIARVYDAISGALALAWLDPGRAGSCSLGAIVIAIDEHGGALVDVVPGGRGAELGRAGASAWPGPVLPAGPLCSTLAVDIDRAPRPDSGGGGARDGGNGMIARYTFAASAHVRVAIDRITNPPHGLDRAGPPLPSAVTCTTASGERSDLAPWQTHAVLAGDCIEVQTAGGAGHGFPGYGIDFDWEP